MLEVGKVLRHRDRLLLALHEGTQALGDADFPADDALDGVAELCRMGGLKEHAVLALAEVLLQGAVGTGAVGVKQVTRCIVGFLHRPGYLFVSVPRAGDVGSHLLHPVVIQLADAGEVARVAHVHGVGDGRDGGTRLVVTRLQVTVEDVVAVVGGDEALDGQPHLLGKQSGGDVAEIPAGDADDHLVRLAQLLHPGVRLEVVERLRQEAGDVDGVGGRQVEARVEVGVEECLLHERLAVVEGAVYLQRGDVAPEGSELLLLDVADLPLGVEHVDADALDAEEAVCHGAPGVTGRGDEHMDRASAFAADEVAQQTCHEACADVLECQRRSVIKFERVDAVGDLHERDVEVECVVDDALQVVGGDVVAEEVACHAVRHFLERQSVDVAEEVFRQRTDVFGHVESPVGGEPAHDGFLEGNFGCLLIGAVVEHVSCLFGWAEGGTREACPPVALIVHECVDKLVAFQVPVAPRAAGCLVVGLHLVRLDARTVNQEGHGFGRVGAQLAGRRVVG